MEEQIRKRLLYSMRTSFDKWNTNYVQSLIEKQQGDNWEEDQKEVYLLNLFLTKRVFIYGFYRYVTKEVENNSVIQKQRNVLLKAIIQSILSQNGVTARELEKSDESIEGYTYTHTRRVINDDYSEIFMKSDDMMKDARFIPYRTVFSPYSLTKEYIEKLRDTIDQTYYYMKSRPDLTSWMMLNAGIMPVTPEHLLSLNRFLKDVQQILKENISDSKIRRVLQKEMSGFTEISGEFNNHFQSMLAVEWWRNRRYKTKRRLIDDGFPFKYTRNDAEQAHNLLLEILGTQEKTYNTMFGSALIFNNRDLPEPAQFLYEECLKMNFLSPLERGIHYENIAVMLRKQSKPKLMVSKMKQAIEEYRQSKDDYRLCVALKNLGEAEWRLGFKETGLRYFKKAEEHSQNLEQPNKASAYWNLAYAARRIGEEKMECNYLLKCLTNCTYEQTNMVIECENRMNQLMC